MELSPTRPVGRPRGFDRDAALDVALGLFWQRGYEGVSFADLTAAIGVASPSLYAAFGDKRALFRAALDRYQTRDGGGIFAALTETGTTARAALQRFLGAAAVAFTREGANRGRGCMISTGLVGCSAELGDMADLVRARRLQSREVIFARLRRAADDAELPPGANPAALADFVWAVLQGMSVQARDGASAEALGAVAEAAMAVWPA